MTALIRASSLTGFPTLVESLGGSAPMLLRRAGIRPEVVEDHDEFIPYRALIMVLEAAADELDCPDFGLRLSQGQGLHILGPVGLIAQNAPSVGDALANLSQFLYVYSPAIGVAVDTDGTEAEYRFLIHLRGVQELTQIGELSIGTSIQCVRLLIGQGFTPSSVSLRHEPLLPLSHYESFFGCPVRAGQEHWSFRFDADALNGLVPGSDRTLRRVVTSYLRGMDTDVPPGLPAEVRGLVKRTMATGYLSIEAISGHLHIHPRTLQRRLAQHGTSFEDLIDQVRRGLAEHYLHNTTMPLAQLARLLGYSEQSSLSRSCVRWFGRPPRQLRHGARSTPQELV